MLIESYLNMLTAYDRIDNVRQLCWHVVERVITNASTNVITDVARNQQGGTWCSREATFSHERGAIDVHRRACGAVWAPARERGAHLRHLGTSLMPMTYGGANVQKTSAL